MSTKVLIVDDDILLARSIKKLCQDHLFSAATSFTPDHAITRLQEESYDIVILDSLFPQGCGQQVVDYIQTSESHSKILMLSTQADCYSRINALKKGVDDYLPKPFHPDELVLKIKKLVHHKHLSKKQFISTPYFVLDIFSGEVVFPEWRVTLRRKEFEILSLLIQHKNQVVTKEVIMEHIWNIDMMPMYATIDVHIRRIRLQIKDKPKKIIQTVYGVGYRYVEAIK